MANTELGKAYVQIIPSMRGAEGTLDKFFSGEGKKASNNISGSLTQGIRSAGSSIVGAVGGTFTNIAATAAGAFSSIGAAISSQAISGGITRAIGLDDAKAKFTQLGMDVGGMMESVSDSVRGTRYALNEAAGIAVTLGSAGVAAGDDMTNALKSVASVASISGRGLDEIGAIYTKVASTGKVTGQVMTQLAYNGINVNAALQQSLGKTSEEISDMVSKGEVDFETFSNAMREYFGDAADSANSTFTGALANTKSALSRIGADFASPVLSKLREVFAGTEENTGLMKAIDKLHEAMQPLIDRFAQFVDVAGGKVANAVGAFADALDGGDSVIEAFKLALGELIPKSLKEKFNQLSPGIQSLIATIGKGGGILAGVSTVIGLISGAVGGLIPGLGGLIGTLGGAGGAFGLVSKAGGTLTSVLQAIIGGGSSSGIGGLITKIGGLTGPIGIAIAAFAGMFTQSESFRSSIGGLVSSIGASLGPILRTLSSVAKQLVPIILSLVGAVGDALAPVIEALTPLISSAIGMVGRVIDVITGALMPVINAIAPPIEDIVRVVGSVIGGIIGIIEPFISALFQLVVPPVNAIKNKLSVIFNAILRVATTIFNNIKSAVSKPIEAAENVIRTAVGKIKDFLAFTGLGAKVSNLFQGIKEKITGPITKAREIVDGVVSRIKNIFPISMGRIFSGLQLPHFKISGGTVPWGIGGKGTKPSVSVEWYRKAESTPYMFKGATLFGAGEHDDELLYGRRALLKDIKDATSDNKRPVNIVNNITVDGAENPEDFASRLVRQLQLDMRAI